MQPENTEPPPELSAPEPEVEHEGEPATPQKAEPVVFASPADPRHIEELCRRFARSFTIDAAEHRAISSVQLTDVLTFALTGCWQWDEAQLKAHSLNHYDVMKWLIKPTTEARCCSFVELVASEAQPPDFFLSHYFGQPVRDVLDSVRQQLSTRQLVEETTFWMWAYARRHDESVVPDRLHSTAFQAMGLSSGILLPLGTTSVPLSRTWCLLEVALAVLELQKPLDIVASALQGPVLLTQDLTEPERRMEGKLAGAGFREKNHREQAFPADILIAALDIGLERSDAASKMDRNRLLHKFVEEGGEASAMPHRQFDKINVKLRGLFASMMWLQVLESDRLPRNSVAECTKANVSKDSFVVNVCNSRMDDSSMHYLSRALHKNLARVDLNFWMCPKISAKGVEDLVRLMPAKLKTVNLNFKLCPGVGQGGLDAVSNSFPSGLTSLHLNFSFNSEIRSLASLCQSIRSLQSLKFLDLDVSAIEKISDKSLLMLAQTLELSRIKNLFLSFRSCTSVTDVGIEAIAGALPDSLTLLKLDLADCNISDASVDALAGRLQLLPEIGVIQVSLQGCQEVTEASVARFAGKLPRSLKGAKLDVCDTSVPKEVQRLCRRLPTMRGWMPHQKAAQAPATTSCGPAPVVKVGLTLESLDLFLHRGHVSRSAAHLNLALKAKGVKVKAPKAPEPERTGRAFSEPYLRQFKALLPKVARPAKGNAIALMAQPECMYSRPRTTHNGFSEPIWFP